MKFLLDTCVILELIKKIPDSSVIKWISECPEDSFHLSVLTIGEIQKGISKLSDKKRKIRIQNWLDKELMNRFAERIIPITSEIATTWGEILAESELKGISIPTIDSLIGATAVAKNLHVVTRNVKDIKKTGARIINPWGH
jgi:hypothetical protein